MPEPDSSCQQPTLPFKTVLTGYPTSPPVEEVIDRFWDAGPEFDRVQVEIEPPQSPLELLTRLGSSPFERGRFPLIGFLATTYDNVARSTIQHG